MTISRSASRLFSSSLLTVLCLTTSLLFSGQALAAAASPNVGGSRPCTDPGEIAVKGITLPSVQAGETNSFTICGQLSNPASRPSKTVLLLVHGATYNHSYWDFPVNPNQYSAVQFFNRAGYSTFSIDRIGIGQSDHPNSADVTFDGNISVEHQIVQRLKGLDSRLIGGVKFAHVILIGHSYGSMTGGPEANANGDVDAVVLTGFLHHLSPSNIDALFLARSHAANLDNSLLARDANFYGSLDSGYLTIAGADPPKPVWANRKDAFYYPPTSDTNIIAKDEQTKETFTGSEAVGLLSADHTTLNAPTNNITVPVLEVIGQKDILFCAPDSAAGPDCAKAQATEAQFFSPDAHLKVLVVAATGHDLTLHHTAPGTYSKIVDWAKLHVAPNAP
jgi:pimeloyl-ACP methyl ester carboxylesterase